jgi:hypothetical protein
MVYFQTKNPSLGKFWRALDWQMLIYFMSIGNLWNIFLPLGTFCVRMVNYFQFWYHVPRKIWQHSSIHNLSTAPSLLVSSFEWILANKYCKNQYNHQTVEIWHDVIGKYRNILKILGANDKSEMFKKLLFLRLRPTFIRVVCVKIRKGRVYMALTSGTTDFCST